MSNQPIYNELKRMVKAKLITDKEFGYALMKSKGEIWDIAVANSQRKKDMTEFEKTRKTKTKKKTRKKIKQKAKKKKRRPIQGPINKPLLPDLRPNPKKLNSKPARIPKQQTEQLSIITYKINETEAIVITRPKTKNAKYFYYFGVGGLYGNG